MGFPEGSGGGVKRAARSHDPLVGTVINGKFHVEKAFARGGMGRIYFGRQAPLDRPVALKIVKADSVNEDESQFLKRFLLEASILAKLQHPNVVTLFDYGRIEGAPVEMYFIAMEFLDGETLTERLRTRGALATFEALILFRQIGRGLREAHNRGIVHRDLKPSNIVIVPEADGEIVKLVDFGIGKVELGEDTEDLTREGVLVGTPKYMAPEQFDGQSSAASDVYALGIIIYQCLAGTLPFQGNTLPELMISKLQRDIPPIHEVNPISDTPPSLERLVVWMLSRRPEDRPTLDRVFEQLAACEDEIFGTSGRRAMSSGARAVGFPTSSRPHSIGALQVPYTIVAPAPRTDPALRATTSSAGVPFISGVTPLPSSHVTGRTEPHTPMTITGFTPRPMATSARPPLPTKSAMPVAIIAAVLFSLVSVIAVAVWLKTRPHDYGPAGIGSGIAVTTTTATATATPVASAFVLRVQSVPPGAVVSEDNTVLGVTPLDVRIDPTSVAKGPRVFILKKEGFADKPITQGIADGNLEQVVTLAPDPQRTVKSPSHQPVGKSPAGKSSPPKSDQGDDIRLKR
jgi:serine/threonine protein kinase